MIKQLNKRFSVLIRTDKKSQIIKIEVDEKTMEQLNKNPNIQIYATFIIYNFGG